MRFGVDRKILRGIAGVFARHPVVDEARVYGSRARGDYREGSDIDIALFAPELSYPEFLRLRSELDDLPCLYKIDVAHFEALENDSLKRSILEDGVLFYRRQRDAGVHSASEAGGLFVREDFPEYG